MSPTLDEIVRDHGERIEALESGHLEVIKRIGSPPDLSTGDNKGTGIAGTISQIATDVRELKERGAWPMRLLKAAGMILAVAVPVAGALAWALTHLRYTP